METLKRFVKDEEGQDMVEYALIGALVSIVAIAIIVTMGGPLQTIWQNIQTELAGAAA